MTDSQPRPGNDDGDSIFAVVAQLARRASDGQLVLAAAAGIAAAAIVGLVRPDWWFVALPLLCQGLLEHYGADHVRPARHAISAALRPIVERSASLL